MNISLNSQTLQSFGAYPNMTEEQWNFHSLWGCKIGLEPTKRAVLLLLGLLYSKQKHLILFLCWNTENNEFLENCVGLFLEVILHFLSLWPHGMLPPLLGSLKCSCHSVGDIYIRTTIPQWLTKLCPKYIFTYQCSVK